MRIGLGPSNNLPIEIPHHSADVAVFSHVVVIVSGHAQPDNFNSATRHARLFQSWRIIG